MSTNANRDANHNNSRFANCSAETIRLAQLRGLKEHSEYERSVGMLFTRERVQRRSEVEGRYSRFVLLCGAGVLVCAVLFQFA